MWGGQAAGGGASLWHPAGPWRQLQSGLFKEQLFAWHVAWGGGSLPGASDTDAVGRHIDLTQLSADVVRAPLLPPVCWLHGCSGACQGVRRYGLGHMVAATPSAGCKHRGQRPRDVKVTNLLAVRICWVLGPGVPCSTTPHGGV
jgi:hypothetical protein